MAKRVNPKFKDKNSLLSRKEYEKWLAWQKREGIDSFADWRDYQVILKEGEHWVWIAAKAPYWQYHTMFIPKRYFKEWQDMTTEENTELMIMLKDGINKMRGAKLRINGELIERYVFFWRLRDNPVDPVSKNVRPAHFHLHLAPDIDHSWDPILDTEAHTANVRGVLGE